jgi:DNA mismatch endonuclease, patch repair protein
LPYIFETNEQRSQIMKKIKGKSTKPEILLSKALWAKGFRYRKNYTQLPGKPDIAITKYKIAIFVDGEFWHGYDWGKKKDRIVANRDYWIPKIEKNIQRDTNNNKKLEEIGWKVIRFWERDVNKNLAECVLKTRNNIPKA